MIKDSNNVKDKCYDDYDDDFDDDNYDDDYYWK